MRLRSRLSGISHGTELSLYRGTSAFSRQGLRPRAAGLRRAAGRQRVGVPGDARVRDGQRGRRGRPGGHRGRRRGPGAHRHAAPGGDRPGRRGVAAGHLPAGGAADGRTTWSGPCSSAWPRSRCRRCTTRRSSSATPSACTGWARSACSRCRCARWKASRTSSASTPTRTGATSPSGSAPPTCSTRRTRTRSGCASAR